MKREKVVKTKKQSKGVLLKSMTSRAPPNAALDHLGVVWGVLPKNNPW